MRRGLEWLPCDVPLAKGGFSLGEVVEDRGYQLSSGGGIQCLQRQKKTSKEYFGIQTLFLFSLSL